MPVAAPPTVSAKAWDYGGPIGESDVGKAVWLLGRAGEFRGAAQVTIDALPGRSFTGVVSGVNTGREGRWEIAGERRNETDGVVEIWAVLKPLGTTLILR